MAGTTIGYLELQIYLPGCESLKEKRSRIKPLLARLHREFNISAAELDHQDVWQSSVIGCTLISNNSVYTQKYLRNIVSWVENNWLDIEIVDDHIEIFKG